MSENIVEIIRKDLYAMSDKKYKDFQTKLIPTIDPDTVLGIRMPVLRNYSKKLFTEGNYQPFIESLPHKYYDENNLHSFIICRIKDFDLCVSEVEKFLPYVDNWAVCDSLCPATFSKNKDKLITKIYEWIESDNTYTVRFAVKMLMSHYLDEDFKEEYLGLVAAVKSDEYYVNMMIAWYFATALAKQYTEAVHYIENKKLSPWVHNKTIQKANESYRINPDIKKHLKTFKY